MGREDVTQVQYSVFVYEYHDHHDTKMVWWKIAVFVHPYSDWIGFRV